jgi:protein-tyrosine phosphatase
MRTEVHWIKMPSAWRLATMPRPAGGDWLEEEIAGWRGQGIDMVVSLLQPDEITELDLGREAELCQAYGIEFVAFPILDRGVPSSMRETAVLAQSIGPRLNKEKGITIHCRAGIGRASLIAACVLLYSGLTPDEAFEMIEKARGMRVPDTEDQRAWVQRFQESIDLKFIPK